MGKDDNVSTYVKNLADMFVKKMDKKGSARVRGKPPAGQRYHMKKPAWTYLFEDKNFALNQRDNFDFQFAPGSVNYNPSFLEMYKKIVNTADQDNIFFLLVRFLENVFKQVSYNKENIVRQMAPRTNVDFICPECGLNHEVRDFIRTILLHLIDQFEMSTYFIKFLKSKDFLNDVAYGELQKIATSNDQIASWRTIKKLVTFRILSVKKGIGILFGRLLGIDKNRKIVYGIFDNSLLGIIHAGSILECYPSILDDNGGNFYIALYGNDDVRNKDNDPSFPNISQLKTYIANINKLIGTQDIFPDPRILYVIEAAMVTPLQIRERSIDGQPVHGFDTMINDGTGEIRLFGQCDDDKLCEELSDRDIIRIIGASVNPSISILEEGEWEVSNVELRISPYGSIEIVEPYITR